MRRLMNPPLPRHLYNKMAPRFQYPGRFAKHDGRSVKMFKHGHGEYDICD